VGVSASANGIRRPRPRSQKSRSRRANSSTPKATSSRPCGSVFAKYRRSSQSLSARPSARRPCHSSTKTSPVLLTHTQLQPWATRTLPRGVSIFLLPRRLPSKCDRLFLAFATLDRRLLLLLECERLAQDLSHQSGIAATRPLHHPTLLVTRPLDTRQRRQSSRQWHRNLHPMLSLPQPCRLCHVLQAGHVRLDPVLLPTPNVRSLQRRLQG
jgi:hypothetical protein